ncbi:MAG: hypothetical protein FWG10_08825 [Eubacteriaceae bacterium]|nr:hypothetical protein [Eubacteriaceae bacterium]
MEYERAKDPGFWTLARNCLHDHMPPARSLPGKSIAAFKQPLKSCLEYVDGCMRLMDGDATFDVSTRENAKNYIMWLKGKNCSPGGISLKLDVQAAKLAFDKLGQDFWIYNYNFIYAVLLQAKGAGDKVL